MFPQGIFLIVLELIFNITKNQRVLREAELQRWQNLDRILGCI